VEFVPVLVPEAGVGAVLVPEAVAFVLEFWDACAPTTGAPKTAKIAMPRIVFMRSSQNSIMV
jgi:hypothetical protein